MARIQEPTKDQERGWKKWVKSRPPIVRAMAEKFDPWSLYRMKDTGQRVTIYSFSENGTLSVNVTGRFNVVTFDRCVFGLSPDDLEPCDVPGEAEPVGAIFDKREDIDAYVGATRPIIRSQQ